LCGASAFDAAACTGKINECATAAGVFAFHFY
jgi:hypothetical protein